MAGQGTVGLEMLEDVPDADVVLVQVGGGGLVSGIATAVKGLKPDARVYAIEPELSNALAASMAAGESVTVEPQVDGGRPQRPVRRPELRPRLPRPRRRERAHHGGGHQGGLPLHVRPDEARVRDRRRRHGGRAARRKGAAGTRRARRARSSPGATWHPKRPLLSWPSDEGRHPSRVRPRHVRCSCGNEFTTRSTKSELHVEVCSNCHPFYTGKQKLMDTGGRVERFQRRLEKAGGARRGS